MKIVGRCCIISGFFMLFLFCSVPHALSQDLFREVSQIKAELSTLKNEVNSLRNLVFELRREFLGQATASGPEELEKAALKEQSVKETAPVDETELTRIICTAVGKFFTEADKALRSRDPSTARSEMNKALQRLNSSLREYSKTHRVTKLLTIYEGLAWSTYTAVQLRQSITGNQDFLRLLEKHKRRYRDTCPRD